MLTLVCAIVGAPGDTFPVDIKASQLVGHLKNAIKVNKVDFFKNIDADELQLFLAKKSGAWLPPNDSDVVAMQSGAIPEKVKNLLNDRIDPAEKIADIFVPAPREKEIHVLLVVPEDESKCPAIGVSRLQSSTVGLSKEVQWKNLSSVLEWKEAELLCGSTGRDWPYQGASQLVDTLTQPLAQHYNAWKHGYQDKQTHAINLVLSEPGTGKLRMLDEMKGLLCKAAKQSGDHELISKMENTYVFRVTFENGTSATGKLLDSESPEFDVSYRMLYQLAKDRRKKE